MTPFYMFAPNRPDTIAGTLTPKFGGFLEIEDAFDTWSKIAPDDARGPMDIMEELVEDSWFMVPTNNQFSNRANKKSIKGCCFHPALFEPVVNVMTRFDPNNADAIMLDAVQYARDLARDLDARVCHYLDPTFNLNGVSAFPNSPHRRPWHSFRRMGADGICDSLVGDGSWDQFRVDDGVVSEARDAGVAITPYDGKVKRMAYVWCRKRQDDRFRRETALALTGVAAVDCDELKNGRHFIHKSWLLDFKTSLDEIASAVLSEAVLGELGERDASTMSEMFASSLDHVRNLSSKLHEKLASTPE